MPVFIQAFLDAFWIVVASGVDQDMSNAYDLVMWGVLIPRMRIVYVKIRVGGTPKDERGHLRS